MQETAKILFLLFIVSFGKSPEAAREFAHLKGKWKVVSAQQRGEKAAPGVAPREVTFAAASAGAAKQPENSMASTGYLDLRHSPPVINITSISVSSVVTPKPSDSQTTQGARRGSSPPAIRAVKYWAIYRVDGDRMELLVMPSLNIDSPPTKFVTTKDGGELLMELKRKK